MVIPEKSTKTIEKTTDHETKPVIQLSEKPQNISDKKEKTVQPKENIATTDSIKSITQILITTFDETNYEYVTDNPRGEITKIMNFAENATINKMLSVKNISTGEEEFISVKSIMKIKQK